MRISYIVLKGMPIGGGIEKFTEEVGVRLANKGHKITVYAMKHYGAENGIYKGIHVQTVPTIKSRSLEKLFASFLATILETISYKSDIIHFHAFGPSVFALIPRIIGRKVVVQGHGIEWKRSKWNALGKAFLKISEYPCVKAPQAITVVSKTQQKYLKQRYGIDAVYIPTGVNPPKILKPHLISERFGLRGNDYILFAARLVREKGAHYLIEAFNRLNTSLKLVIAGDAQYEEKYKEELRLLAKNSSRIIFTGFVTGDLLAELFSNCYFFVLPSEIEGLPTALLEAMSYGNCCLASDIEENLEALNGYGYSFRTMDVKDLTQKMKLLIENPELVSSIKEKAKEYVLTNYSWDSIANKIENFYKQLLEVK
jgi:glycosyltransferase involved in cell wall biosynthesis